MNARCTPFSVRSTPASSAAGGCAARRSSRRRSRSASAARRCSGRRSPSGDRCTPAAGPPCGRIRARASPLISMPSSCPDLIHVVARLPLRHGAGEDVARRGERVHRARGDAAAVALLPRRCRSRRASAAVRRRRRRSAASDRGAAVWPRCSLPSTSRMPAISRRAAASDQPRAGAREERAQVAVPRVFEREAVEHPPVGAASAETCRRRGSRADGRPAAGRNRLRAASRRCAALTLMQTSSGTAVERPRRRAR